MSVQFLSISTSVFYPTIWHPKKQMQIRANGVFAGKIFNRACQRNKMDMSNNIPQFILSHDSRKEIYTFKFLFQLLLLSLSLSFS